MKFFTAFALSVLSLNALAAPVLTEGDRLFHDTEYSTFYYVPDELNLTIPEESIEPIFALIQKEDGTGNLISSFRVNRSRNLNRDVEIELDYGGKLASLPITFGYTRIHSQYKSMLKVEHSFVMPKTTMPIHFTATTTIEGTKILAEQLKSNPENLKFLDVCYVVDGVSPMLNGTYSYNLNKIYNYFAKHSKTEMNYEELRNVIQVLHEMNEIQIDMFGEGSKNDYYASIARKVIDVMFKKVDLEDQYVLKSDLKLKDLNSTADFKGREWLTKEFCIEANFKALKNNSQLIKVQ